MNKKTTAERPGGRLVGNFNKIVAYVGLSWFTSMVIIRYVIKPLKLKSQTKENEELMNYLYDEQKKKNVQDEFKT